MADLTCRMYALIDNSIHPNKIAIHLGLALQAYNNIMFDIEEEKSRGLTLPYRDIYTHGAFKQWTQDKDLVLVNCTKSGNNEASNLNSFLEKLSKHNIETGVYFDSENENKLTCIVFIADERAYNNIDYPNFIDFLSKQQEIEDNNKSYETIVEEIKSNRSTIYLDWVRSIGGERNEFMRDFIKELGGNEFTFK